jgi:predicted permease
MLPEGVRRFFRLERGARDVAADVEAELGDHFERKVQALVAGGLDAGAARAEALRQFGDLSRTREALMKLDLERSRAGERAGQLEGLWQDFREVLRSLARAPGLTAAVVIMLGLGIGAASAMYGLLDRLLLRVGPHVEAPGELRRLHLHEFDRRSQARGYRQFFSHEELAEISKALPEPTPLAISATMRDDLDGDASDRVPVMYVSGDAFAVLGVRPLRGRLLEPGDDAPLAPPAAVISEAFWRSRYGEANNVLDTTLRLSGITYSIVGVAPAGFSWLRPERVDVWVPLVAGMTSRYPHWDWRRGNITFEAVVRVTSGGAAEALSLAAERAMRERAATSGGDTAATALLASVVPGKRPGGATTRMRLSLIVAGVALILCGIAVANATNLLMLRSVQRRRDTAIRLALGVGRWRLVRTVVIESLVLAIAGAGVAGLVAGRGGELLRALIIRTEWQTPIMEPRVLLFALLVGLMIGVGTGLLPGWQAGRTDAIAVLKAGSRTGQGRSLMRHFLVAFQAACTIVLLAGLALYTRSFLRAAGTDYGIEVDRLIVASLGGPPALRGDTTGRLAASTAAVAERLATLPGVVAVSQVNLPPVWGWAWTSLWLEGVDSVSPGDNGPFTSEVDHAFLAVAGMRLARGRWFLPEEIAPGSPAVVVNRSLAERYWPGQEVLGKCIRVGRQNERDVGLCRRVVGVVENYRARLNEPAPQQVVYVPLGYRWHTSDGGHSVMVRTAGRPGALVPIVQLVVREIAPETNLGNIIALGDIPGREREPWLAGMRLFAIFAVLAVLLAVAGLYSVVAWSVAQRRPEFGVRIALGARSAHLVRMVLALALRPAAIGLVVGFAATLWLVRFLAPLLFQIEPRDPLALAAAGAALLIAAAGAALVPAADAARTDPREALQAE